ncbi:ABC transporter permease [Bacillus sp. PK3_68]|uniref:ABC transporter permease n=1 Tax=Bacillus sp. PK3_68 TaxID=2027408 RepID=UPI000E71FF04|nr:ABC transporter permease [Bacillus sp. PK3_68]RJS50270.1 ABC transporter permease [Bacillus sp. PK3_68]
MLFKLSISGLKSKLKDYIVLLVGLVMSIAIFYMFQTLALNKAFLEANATIKSIGYVFQTGSVLLAIITFFYIFYANSFLMSLRRKEFGMYMTLGAKKNKITLLMFIETIIIGTVSLVIGISVGSGLAQGIGKLLMKQLDFTANGYQAIYVPSMTVTCIFFFLLFILSAIMNSIKLSRISILQLVHGDTYADSIIIKGKMTGIVALFSLILLGMGYASMVYLENLKESRVMIAMLSTTAGTYLFFEALFPLFVKKLRANKACNEKGLNAFTFAQLNFRINGLTKVLSTVAMLIALGAGAISGGWAFKNNVMTSADRFEIYDSVINNPTPEEMKILDDIPFKEKGEYRYKVDDQFFYYVKEDLEKYPPLIHVRSGEENMSKLKRVSEDLPVGSTSVYSQENQQNTKIIPDEWEDALTNIQPIYIEDLNKPIKIVDLKMYHELPGKTGIIFTGKTDEFIAHTKKWKQLDELQLAKNKDVKAGDMLSKYKIYNEFYTVASGTVFMGFFLGFAFLAMMASCLMFKILSGATSDITRYEMLRKIGVRRELLIKSIYKELFIVFLVPAIIGMTHVLIGMNIFGFILIDPYYRIWLPIVIFLTVYTAYYLITVHLYKGLVIPKKI